MADRIDEIGADPRATAARKLAARGAWAEAAGLYLEIGEDAAAGKQFEVAVQAWTLAGDALRRDDRPAAAARALTRALALAEEGAIVLGDQRAALMVELGGVLVDAGHLEVAQRHAEEAFEIASTDAARTVALDVVLGVQLAQGDAAAARKTLDALEDCAPEVVRVAIRFRGGAVLRLEGDLDEAEAAFVDSREQLTGRAGMEGLVGAVAAAQGDLDLLRGRMDTALTRFDESEEAWRVAGRQAGQIRAEAGRVRVALGRGDAPLAAVLSKPVHYADSRGMTLLEAELRVVRGAAWARHGLVKAEWDLDQAVRLAESSGATLLEGRARLVRRASGIRRNDDEAIRELLSGDVVFSGALDGGEDEAIPW